MTALGLLLAAVLGANWLEQSMARHMLLQLPAIALAGYLLAARIELARRTAWFDLQGLTGFAVVMAVSSVWMIPRTLELATRAWPVEAAKFASVLLAGALLHGALQRANRIVQLFFLGNFCAMGAIVGMLYQEQPRQLCNVYTVDDQVIAGIGLVAGACAIALAWCVRHYRAFVDGTMVLPSRELP